MTSAVLCQGKAWWELHWRVLLLLLLLLLRRFSRVQLCVTP